MPKQNNRVDRRKQRRSKREEEREVDVITRIIEISPLYRVKPTSQLFEQYQEARMHKRNNVSTQ